MTKSELFGRFKVLRGSHHEYGRTYRKGEVVDSKVNLVKLHNHPGSTKFEKVSGDYEPQDDLGVADLLGKEKLEAMTVPALRELAEGEEVELAPNMKKEDIISALLVEA